MTAPYSGNMEHKTLKAPDLRNYNKVRTRDGTRRLEGGRGVVTVEIYGVRVCVN